MRFAALSFLALGFAACGGEQDNEVRVALPLSAPDGAHELVADFVDICSLSLVDRGEAMQLADDRGWASEVPQADLMAQFTGMAMYSDPNSGAQLQITPIAYPHLDIKLCMVNLFDHDFDEDDLNLSVIHEIDGLQGGFFPMPGDADGVGRWSFIGPNGEPVILQAMRPTASFVQLHMSTDKRLYPNKSK